MAEGHTREASSSRYHLVTYLFIVNKTDTRTISLDYIVESVLLNVNMVTLFSELVQIVVPKLPARYLLWKKVRFWVFPSQFAVLENFMNHFSCPHNNSKEPKFVIRRLVEIILDNNKDIIFDNIGLH